MLFCAGGIATPADAALMMALGAEGVFVGSGIFKSEDPPARARAIVEATTHWQDPERVAARLARARAGDGQPGEREAGGRAAAGPARLVAVVAWERRATGVGVLALQGGFEAHERVLRGLGAEVREVRTAADLDGHRRARDPGGRVDDDDARDRARGPGGAAARSSRRAGVPVLGSCAGLIMLDRDHLGLMDMRARRNAFGRQLQSFETDLELRGLRGGPLRAVFIRAPWIAEHGPDVEILAEVDGHPVAARQGNMLAVAFHAELTGDDRLHRLFLSAM